MVSLATLLVIGATVTATQYIQDNINPVIQYPQSNQQVSQIVKKPERAISTPMTDTPQPIISPIKPIPKDRTAEKNSKPVLKLNKLPITESLPPTDDSSSKSLSDKVDDDTGKNVKPKWDDLNTLQKKRVIFKYLVSKAKDDHCGSRIIPDIEGDGVSNQRVVQAGYVFGANWTPKMGNSYKSWNKAYKWLSARGVFLPKLTYTPKDKKNSKKTRGEEFDISKIDLLRADQSLLEQELRTAGLIASLDTDRSDEIRYASDPPEQEEYYSEIIIEQNASETNDNINYQSSDQETNWQDIDTEWDNIFANYSTDPDRSDNAPPAKPEDYYEDFIIEYAAKENDNPEETEWQEIDKEWDNILLAQTTPEESPLDQVETSVILDPVFAEELITYKNTTTPVESLVSLDPEFAEEVKNYKNTSTPTEELVILDPKFAEEISKAA